MSKYSRFWEFGRKIICVGRNFREHAKELGNEVPDDPIIFLKPTTAYVREPNRIKLPPNTNELHHEVELGVVIGKNGANIAEENAMDYVAGYCVALDMTDRQKQTALKKKGLPWSLAKSFDTSCPVGDFLPKDVISNPEDVRLWLKVNDVIRQDGQTDCMIFSPSKLISFVSGYFTLEEGDLILTGTPSGVGPVKSGDSIEAGVNELSSIKFLIE